MARPCQGVGPIFKSANLCAALNVSVDSGGFRAIPDPPDRENAPQAHPNQQAMLPPAFALC
ncbi:MAG: hypothetical protein CFE34_13940 [Rhodobacteraceae bacterium PARR1]|nr:MAG: hypothetical protein CFE34_13940 [Rhodobacteraceae bacterium PARR1]